MYILYNTPTFLFPFIAILFCGLQYKNTLIVGMLWLLVCKKWVWFFKKVGVVSKISTN